MLVSEQIVALTGDHPDAWRIWEGDSRPRHSGGLRSPCRRSLRDLERHASQCATSARRSAPAQKIRTCARVSPVAEGQEFTGAIFPWFAAAPCRIPSLRRATSTWLNARFRPAA